MQTMNSMSLTLSLGRITQQSSLVNKFTENSSKTFIIRTIWKELTVHSILMSIKYLTSTFAIIITFNRKIMALIRIRGERSKPKILKN